MLYTLKNNDVHVVESMSLDGLSPEQRVLKQQTLKFMHGHSSTVGVMYPNHWAKSYRSQPVLGTETNFIGKMMIECGLPLLCKNIPKEVTILDDYVSDFKVLKLSSTTTIESLISLDR